MQALYYRNFYCGVVVEPFFMGFSNSAASGVDVVVIGISFSIGRLGGTSVRII